LDFDSSDAEHTQDDAGFIESLDRWRESHSVGHAADVLSGATVLGRTSEALDAARELMVLDTTIPQSLRQLARSAVDGKRRTAPMHPLPTGDERADTVRRIRVLRARSRIEPRNPFAWADLSRAYVLLNQPEPALRAMFTALALAARNRFVIRAAVRLCVHLGAAKEGRRIVHQSNAALGDPWIMATDIALNRILPATSRFTKAGKSLVESGSFSPRHVTELASAVGTTELDNGHTRHARRFIRTSLLSPNDNSLAQALVLARDSNLTEVDSSRLQPVRPAPESQAIAYSMNARWPEAVEQALAWLDDQPFSVAPAEFGSFTAATALGDVVTAKKFAERGLLANPRDFGLLNNHAYAAALSGDLAGAQSSFGRIDPARLERPQRVVWLATSGLLKFRTGAPEEGRRLYAEAVTLARELGNQDQLALAHLNLARELAREHDPAATQARRQALELARKATNPAIRSAAEHSEIEP
jgi:tetratricopeptide (TPR) repeat protein